MLIKFTNIGPTHTGHACTCAPSRCGHRPQTYSLATRRPASGRPGGLLLIVWMASRAPIMGSSSSCTQRGVPSTLCHHQLARDRHDSRKSYRKETSAKRSEPNAHPHPRHPSAPSWAHRSDDNAGGQVSSYFLRENDFYDFSRTYDFFTFPTLLLKACQGRSEPALQAR
jgi:hypothetical protein